ncbi:MAG: type IV secretory system conjugative DNA transfer family protein [Clostridia bacterium]|nr:type IV secretory system conjugative DNA transfer family protein [Clostridia bacterium]
MKSKKEKKFVLIMSILVLIGSVIVGFATKPETEIFNTTNFLLVIGIGGGLLLFYVLLKILNVKPESGADSQGKTVKGDKVSQYYDAAYISKSELETLSKFSPCTWDGIGKLKKDGIVIREELVHGKLHINLYDPIHTLIIGTTGSGKTQTYINPSIRILSQIGTKPCLVMTDPKGELYRDHYIQLKEAGYRIMVIDLRNPYASTRWNPLDNAYTLYQRANNLTKEVKIHRNDKPTDYKKLKLADDVKNYGAEWYEFNRVAYSYKEQLRGDLEARAQELKTDAENELKEIAMTLVPIEAANDKTWEQGAQNFLNGILLAMLEDSLDPSLGMTRERFNFYNMAKIASYKDDDPDNPYGSVRKYCANRGDFSKVPALTSTAINNAPNTTRSYMGILDGKIGVFQDNGICYCTSKSDMNFDDFTDQPTALFIKVPDEKESRHFVATMCISQLYKKLVEKASENDSLKLNRNVYFMLDEFANLPKIPKMDSIITVGRSRGLFFSLVIQSYSQLETKYGKDVSETIKGNCNIQVFIGTDDQKTRDDFSKLCGDISLEMKNTSRSKSFDGGSDKGINSTTSSQRVTRPLIYPYELGQLEKFEVVVKIFKENAIRVKMAPFFAVKEFDKRKANEVYAPAQALNEAEIYYDFKARNKKVKKSNSDFDDFDF